eukprot:COSAG05_NODE_6861_length_891_cov_1.782828_1_plen_72_part_00
MVQSELTEIDHIYRRLYYSTESWHLLIGAGDGGCMSAEHLVSLGRRGQALAEMTAVILERARITKRIHVSS